MYKLVALHTDRTAAEYIPGVPARDLTDEEYRGFVAQGLIVEENEIVDIDDGTGEPKRDAGGAPAMKKVPSAHAQMWEHAPDGKPPASAVPPAREQKRTADAEEEAATAAAPARKAGGD